MFINEVIKTLKKESLHRISGAFRSEQTCQMLCDQISDKREILTYLPFTRNSKCRCNCFSCKQWCRQEMMRGGAQREFFLSSHARDSFQFRYCFNLFR